MADNANGKPTEEEEPSESDSTEVKSSIVMRIDAPDTEQPQDEHDDDVHVVRQPFVSRSFSSISRGFPPHRPSPSSSCFGSVATFCHSSATSTNHGSYNSKSSVATSSNMGSPAAKPLLLRPSQLAVASNEVTNSDSAEHRIGSTTEADCPVRSPSSEVSASGRHELSSSHPAPAPAPTLKFVPLGAALHHKDDNCSVSNSGVSSSASSFVFGQNLHARAASVAVETADSTSGRQVSPLLPTTQAATSNGTSTSEMLFTSVMQGEPANADNGAPGSSEVERSGKSLSEAAAEYEESRSKKRKYEEVSLFTGEEGETNVGQVNCRLYVYDNTNGQYVERGRGTLRVNDSPGGAHSRVLMRATGSLRVVLNTKIWSGMSVGRPSPKSIRLTAMESTGQIKVFLVMASVKEIDTLHKLLQARVARCFTDTKSSEEVDAPSALLSKRREVQDAGGGDEPDQVTPGADL